MPGFHHRPVLGEGVVRLLAPRPGALVLDGTLGGGGHSELLLMEGADVIGLDRDPAALAAASGRLSRFGDRFRAVRADFRAARDVLRDLGVTEVQGALVDLGVSSPQLDDPARGFSFRAAGPLDMRMGPDGETLREYLERTPEKDLARAIATYGEERFARPIARAILRELPRIEDTAQLAGVVAGAIPRRAWPRDIHPATRTFQALRIAVNDELGALAAWLASLPGILARGGRAAAISFHSLEDRAVKRAFADLAHPCRCPPGMPVCACGAAEWALLTRKPVVAGDDEIADNPRSRSAKLRAVERLQENSDAR